MPRWGKVPGRCQLLLHKVGVPLAGVNKADDEYLSRISGVYNIPISNRYALERQYSLREVIPGGNPTGMSCLYNSQ